MPKPPIRMTTPSAGEHGEELTLSHTLVGMQHDMTDFRKQLAFS